MTYDGPVQSGSLQKGAGTTQSPLGVKAVFSGGGQAGHHGFALPSSPLISWVPGEE